MTPEEGFVAATWAVSISLAYYPVGSSKGADLEMHSLWKCEQTARWLHPPRRRPALALQRVSAALHGTLVERLLAPLLH